MKTITREQLIDKRLEFAQNHNFFKNGLGQYNEFPVSDSVIIRQAQNEKNDSIWSLLVKLIDKILADFIIDGKFSISFWNFKRNYELAKLLWNFVVNLLNL